MNGSCDGEGAFGDVGVEVPSVEVPVGHVDIVCGLRA
jgi:hypothetical protein